MSDVEVKQAETLTRDEAARRLSALAAALADGDKIEVELGTSTLKAHVPDEVRCEIELEVDEGEIELEVELKWSTVKPAAAGAVANRVSSPSGRRGRGTRR
jgi:amphi-Trp domain-containing protein